MNTVWKRICGFTLVVLLVLTNMPARTVRAEGSLEAVDVQSAEELEAAINGGAERIRVTADFALDRTFYITGSTTMFAEEAHTLTRAADFGGDLFVGEDAEGVSAISTGKSAELTLGDPDSGTADLLIIDGNRMNMTVPVEGTVVFICFSAVVNIHKNVSLVNHRKTANRRTLEARYNLPSPENIGGAAAITVQGVLNIYGGRFEGNVVNSETVIDEENTDKTSTTGALIFNYSNLNIYGGTFSRNQAARGGVLYNYRMTRIYGGTFSNNTATTYAGVIYQPDSQYSETLIGTKYSDQNVIFEDNRSAGIGGAIFVQSKAAHDLPGQCIAEHERRRNLLLRNAVGR